MIKLNNAIITPTIFPDKTSQIWKIEELEKTSFSKLEITWEFENESELIQVLQLADLCYAKINVRPDLIMPYLPYGRQDKEISNTSTFALWTFLSVIANSRKFNKIKSLDIHSPYHLQDIINVAPTDFIYDVIAKTSPDLICFPDKGASNRGYFTSNIPTFSLSKKRNQDTGEIEGLTCDLPLDLKGKSVLILDDITDAGGTFIQASKLLKELGADKVFLYTTHGLYTKGTRRLFDAGIDRIFNYKGEVKNEN